MVNHGDRKEFRVRGLENLQEIVKFFNQNPLQTSKRDDFEIFSKVLQFMKDGEHLKKEGLQKIADLASKTNRKVTRNLESSETIRQTSGDR